LPARRRALHRRGGAKLGSASSNKSQKVTFPRTPAENWLPINRQDLRIGVIMRVYQPDLEKMKTWIAPKA